MAEKQALTARMPPDTYRRVEKYREARDLTKSDAGRRLVEAGLDAEKGETSTTAPSDLTLVLLSALLGAVLGFGMLTHGLFGVAVLLAAAAIGGVIGKIAIDRRGGEDG